MINRYRTTVLILLIGVLLLSIGAAAASGYSLTPSASQDSVDVPTQKVDKPGIGSATIESISTLKEGGSVTVQPEVEDGKSNPQPQLRDRENSKIHPTPNPDTLSDGETKTYDSSVFIPSGQSEVTAGTYVASLWNDGSVVGAHPIVVQGYDISVNTPGTVESGTSATLTADVTKRSIPLNSNFKNIEVIIGNEDIEKQKIMDKNGKNKYSVNISTDDLDSKTYNVYAIARGDEQISIFDQNEMLGISDTVDLTIDDINSDDGSDNDSDDGSDNDSDDGSDNDSDDGSDNDSDDGSNSGSSGGGGQGGGSMGGSESDETGTSEDSSPTPQNVEDTLSLVDPKNEVTFSSDSDASGKDSSSSNTDSEGTQSLSGSSSGVSAVEFDGENTPSVTVKNYGAPPQSVETEVINSIAAYNSEVDPATNSNLDSEDTDSASENSDSSDASSSSGTRVISISDVSPTEDLNDDETTASVTFSIDKTEVTNPEQLTVYKEEYVFEAQEEQWIKLDSSVAESNDGSIEVTAQTTEFSLFVITETLNSESQRTRSTEQNNTDSQRTSTETESETPGFGIPTALISILTVRVLVATTRFS